MMQTRKFGIPVMALAAVTLMLATPAAAAAGKARGVDAKDSKQESAAPIDVNTATVEELMSVPGIGQVVAQRIAEYREKNGPFKTVDDLLKVQGIGEKSLEKLRGNLTVGKAKK